MSRARVCVSAFAMISAAGMFLASTGCDRGPATSLSAPGAAGSFAVRPRNVLLITLDTTRADRLGCFGYAAARTPTLDALATGGTLFERAYCQVPLTLPSHASILTGKYPREFGVRDNGRTGLGSEHETIATIARRAGLKTGAFVGSFVLDSRFGLDRGFDIYDDDLKRPSLDAKLLDVERPAGAVTDAALRWLDRLGDAPFFAWVHFYDPHDPYAPPEGYRDGFATPYDGEIAFVDSQIRRLVDWLAARQRREPTLIVVAGDHGESFGEHGVAGHTTFLYETNLHVPLIFNFAGSVPSGTRVSATVEIAGVCRTICDLAGWAAPQRLLTASLADAFRGQVLAPQACYAESHYVHNAHGWAEQRALVSERWKYVSTTRPELFDLAADPAEKSNQIATQPDVATDLRRRLMARYQAMLPGAGSKVDAAGRRAIESLGYTGGSEEESDAFLSPGVPDPKEMLPALADLQKTQSLIQANRPTEALPPALRAAEACPGSLQFQYTLGALYVQLNRAADAQRVLKRALEIDPRDARLLEAMGDALGLAGDRENALRHYSAALELDDSDAESHVKLARLLRAMRRTDEAAAAYARALERFAAYTEAGNELLALYAAEQRAAEAVAVFERLAAANPQVAEAHFHLGVALLMNGAVESAAARLREAIRLRRNFGAAHVKLGVSLALLGRADEATAAYAAARQFADSAPDAWYNEGVGFEKSGRSDDAVAAYRRAVGLRPDMVNAIVALTRHLLARSEFVDAAATLRAGVEHCPAEIRLHSTLADLLSTCENDRVRNGPEAVRHALRACELVGSEHAGLLGTLAAAHAESGEYDRAAEIAARARVLAEQAGNAKDAATLEEAHSLYAQRRPLRKAKY